jgi:hypothetical protein
MGKVIYDLFKRVMNKIRLTVYLFLAICCILFSALESKAENEDAGQAKVKSESLTVFSRTSSKSEIVKTLRRGDVVTVEFELEGTEGAWCGIIEEGQASISGYVQCQYLERQTEQKKSWTNLGSSGAKESNSGKYYQQGKAPPSSKLRPYSDITVTLYMTCR